MVRGGKRERAGRKTTWESGVKFEETSPIRVPNHIKNKILEIAHRLDAGEEIDFVSNSDKQHLQELELKLELVELENHKLVEQVENYCLDLETESKSFQSKVNELEQENFRLQNLLDKNQLHSSNSSNIFANSISDFVQKWQKKLNGLPPIDIAAKTHQMLFELKEIASNEKSQFEIVTKSNSNKDISEIETVTKSEVNDDKTVTKSKKHTQLRLIGVEPNLSINDLKTLTAIELSKRFNKNESFVKVKKNYYKDRPDDFLILLQQSDPQGVSWRYSEKDKKYHPVFEKQDLRV
jgi:hypothetical protein